MQFPKVTSGEAATNFAAATIALCGSNNGIKLML